MNKETLLGKLKTFEESIEGDVLLDEINLIAYSTDASAYKEKPHIYL